MDRKATVKGAKTVILSHLDKNLDQVLGLIKVDESVVVLASLIFALGYEEVTEARASDLVSFCATSASGKQNLLSYDLSSGELSGPLEEQIPRVFSVVKSIEGVLSDSLELPHEMRQKRIMEAIHVAGVTEERYKTILKNWKSY